MNASQYCESFSEISEKSKNIESLKSYLFNLQTIV